MSIAMAPRFQIIRPWRPSLGWAAARRNRYEVQAEKQEKKEGYFL
jgi:hypothetical protein